MIDGSPSGAGADRFIRVAVSNTGEGGAAEAEVEVPELGGVLRSYTFGGAGLDDGAWHRISVRFRPKGVVVASVDGENPVELTLDADVRSLTEFVSSGYVVVGAEITSAPATPLYSTSSGSASPTEAVDIVPAGGGGGGGGYAMSDFFRGCLGELRVGGVLLPYFTEEQLVNSTASRKFVIRQGSGGGGGGDSLPEASSECVLCYQEECRNGGECRDPSSVFECRCPEGFEDPVCGTNVDECLENRCANGECVDGVASYECRCLPGWTGPL